MRAFGQAIASPFGSPFASPHRAGSGSLFFLRDFSRLPVPGNFSRNSAVNYWDADASLLKTAAVNELVREDGRLRLGPTKSNQIPYSYRFDLWANVSLTSYSWVTDPFGGQNALRSTPSGANDFCRKTVVIPANTARYSVSVYAKANKSGQKLYFTNTGVNNSTFGALAAFNFDTLAFESLDVAGVLGRYEDLGGGLLRLKLLNFVNSGVETIFSNRWLVMSGGDVTLYGWQMEKDSVNSHIVTTGTEQSKAADTLNFSTAVPAGSVSVIVRDLSIEVPSSIVQSGNKGLLSANGSANSLLYYDNTGIHTTDGTSVTSVAPTWDLGDKLDLALVAEEGGNLRLGYRKNGGAAVWDSSGNAFDGAFASNGLLSMAVSALHTQRWGRIEGYRGALPIVGTDF